MKLKVDVIRLKVRRWCQGQSAGDHLSTSSTVSSAPEAVCLHVLLCVLQSWAVSWTPGFLTETQKVRLYSSFADEMENDTLEMIMKSHIIILEEEQRTTVEEADRDTMTRQKTTLFKKTLYEGLEPKC